MNQSSQDTSLVYKAVSNGMNLVGLTHVSGHHACLLVQTLNLGSVRNFPGKMHAYQAELAASMPVGMDESYTHNQTDTHTPTKESWSWKRIGWSFNPNP